MQSHVIEHQIAGELNARPEQVQAAVRLLDEGASVQEACDRSGFSDCSRFIAQFRAHCGRTPLQYKKRDLSEK